MRSGDFKETYGELVALTDSPPVWLWSVVLVVALILAPYLLNSYALSFLTIILITVVGALGLTRVLINQLYEIKPTDPLTFVGVSLVLLFVALFASWLPARRASRVDPSRQVLYRRLQASSSARHRCVSKAFTWQ